MFTSFSGPFSYRFVLCLPLSDPTKIHPYRETPVARPPVVSPCVFRGIADYRSYTPASFHQDLLLQSKDMPWRGGIARKAYLWSLSCYTNCGTLSPEHLATPPQVDDFGAEDLLAAQALFPRVGGPNSLHPHHPTPEHTLLGVGGVLKRGQRGGSKCITPPPLEMPCGQKQGRGGGGGVCNFSWKELCHPKAFLAALRPQCNIDNPSRSTHTDH